MTVITGMWRGVRLAGPAAAIALMGSACGSSGGTPSASPTPQQTTAAASSAMSSTSSASAPTTLDPCQVVTAQEASQLSGGSFGPGAESTTAGGGKVCVYGSQTLNVFTVIVAQAPDATTAQADWTKEQADAQAALQRAMPPGVSASLNVSPTTITGADRAAMAQFSTSFGGRTVGITAVYVLKGATFFTFSDLVLDHAPPGSAAMQAQAQTSLGRLP